MPTKCKMKQSGCEGTYKKWSISQKCCSNPLCALELVRINKDKKARKLHREAKISAKPRREYVALAQQAFNAYIRARDAHLTCIDCGEMPKISGKYGGDWDAGHFLTVGAYPELRFNEDNCHKQLKSCNAGSGKYTHKGKTVSQAYRDKLIEKIGLERVLKLEGPHEPQKWTIEELRAIIKTYKEKIKQLKQGVNNEVPHRSGIS